MHDLILTIDKKDLLQELLRLVIHQLTSDDEPKKSIKLSGVYSDEDIDYSVKQLATTFRSYCLHDITDDELSSRFVHLPLEFQQMILGTVKARSDEIIEKLTEDINSRTADVMTSFDWDLRWVLGNSSCSSYRTQIANLLLNLRTSKGEHKQIHMELKKEHVEELINALESVAT